MKNVIILLILSFAIQAHGQCDKDLDMYQHYQIKTKMDTINYHIYSKTRLDSVSKVLLFIQGSGGLPMYQIDRNERGLSMVSTVPFDLETIPNEYAFVLVSKKGIPFCTKLTDEFNAPKIYYENEGLSNRVERIDQVINHLLDNTIKNSNKVVVLGHSEGSDVVAKLGTLNNRITHIGFWSGGGNTQLFDFTIFIRKDVLSGKITEEVGLQKMDSLFMQFKKIIEKPNSITDSWEDNTFRRWNTFSEPPIENLLQIDIPLFVAIGAKDQAVSVESAYLIPIEFIRHKKSNLDFIVYPELDHGFEKELENGEFEDHWNDVFKEFLNWVENN
jgi:dienelactone hydrolase